MARRFATDHFQHQVRLEMRPKPGDQTSGDARYHDAVLEIARELQSTVDLVREGATDADKEDPPV
jgi:hypothetical protein